MESWQTVWEKGFQPRVSTPGLEALARALREDDPALLQGQTTEPPPLMCVQDWPVTGACALGFCGWKGDGLATVGAVEEYFARACFACDQAVGEPAGCRWLLNWFDETDRPEVRAKLLPVIEAELARRKEVPL